MLKWGFFAKAQSDGALLWTLRQPPVILELPAFLSYAS
jgi:hypothetical protein